MQERLFIDSFKFIDIFLGFLFSTFFHEIGQTLAGSQLLAIYHSQCQRADKPIFPDPFQKARVYRIQSIGFFLRKENIFDNYIKIVQVVRMRKNLKLKLQVSYKIFQTIVKSLQSTKHTPKQGKIVAFCAYWYSQASNPYTITMIYCKTSVTMTNVVVREAVSHAKHEYYKMSL